MQKPDKSEFHNADRSDSSVSHEVSSDSHAPPNTLGLSVLHLDFYFLYLANGTRKYHETTLKAVDIFCSKQYEAKAVNLLGAARPSSYG